ncbi:MAG: alpha/beta fold hydrolase [Clostridia bacterium]|nr:alpha/beta fold hydrolase [Clostridia bacterium]
MATKYPIVLVHGVALKEKKHFKAFGRIKEKLCQRGYDVYIADTDGFGTIENNGVQLKDFIYRVLDSTGAEKVNIIAHSKGGLDSKYMISELGMEEKVASLTTLCTPHKGSLIASGIWGWHDILKKPIAFFIDSFYKYILGDKNPDSMTVCRQLCYVDEGLETLGFTDKVYCQSYSSTLKSGKDCFLMALPMRIYKHFSGRENDGMVSNESAKFANYKGSCLDESISHIQIIDILAKPKSREAIYDFYDSICKELEDMSF